MNDNELTHHRENQQLIPSFGDFIEIVNGAEAFNPLRSSDFLTMALALALGVDDVVASVINTLEAPVIPNVRNFSCGTNSGYPPTLGIFEGRPRPDVYYHHSQNINPMTK